MTEVEIIHGVSNSMTRDLRARPAEELTDRVIDEFVAETKKWVGREIELRDHDAFMAKQPVEQSEIRRYCLGNTDPNPLFIDPDYATATRWGSVIAPPMFACGCATATWGTMPVQIPGLLQNTHFLHAGVDWEMLRPVRVGDLVRPQVFFNDIEVKFGNFAGPMFLNSTKSIYRNQRGEVLGILKNYDMAFAVARAQSTNRYDDIPKEQATPPLIHPDLGRWTIQRRGSTPRYFEDVSIGEQLPATTYHYTIMDIVAQLASGRVGQDFLQDAAGVGCHWHYHPETCFQVRAMPLPFDMGRTRLTRASRLLTDWAGDDGWVWKLNLQLRKPIFAGDTVVVSGVVTDKFVDDGRHCVVIDVRYQNQRDEISCKGNATVMLPSRSEGEIPVR